MKYVKNLLSITAYGEYCCLATRADDNSGQVSEWDPLWVVGGVGVIFPVSVLFHLCKVW